MRRDRAKLPEMLRGAWTSSSCQQQVSSRLDEIARSKQSPSRSPEHVQCSRDTSSMSGDHGCAGRTDPMYVTCPGCSNVPSGTVWANHLQLLCDLMGTCPSMCAYLIQTRCYVVWGGCMWLLLCMPCSGMQGLYVGLMSFRISCALFAATWSATQARASAGAGSAGALRA